MIRKIFSELRFFKAFTSENSVSAYLDYRRSRMQGSDKTMDIKRRGVNYRIRPSEPDMTVLQDTAIEISVLKHVHGPDAEGVIVDAGGFIGSAAIEMAKLFPKARIITIEASSRNFEVLKHNVAAYPLIEPVHAALTDDNAPDVLQLRNRGTGAWGYSVTEGEGGNVEEVPTLHMSKLLEMVGDEPIMLFKMDIEGAETSLLETPYWLERTGVLLIELHERIVAGCEATFFKANKGRCIIKAGGEKFISTGRAFFP